MSSGWNWKGFRVVSFLFFLIIISSEVATARDLNLARKNVAIHEDEGSLSSSHFGFTSPSTGSRSRPVCNRPGSYKCLGPNPIPRPEPCNRYSRWSCPPPQIKPPN